MWVYFYGQSGDDSRDPMNVTPGERERISKACPTHMAQATIEKWLRLGRKIERITLISDDDVTTQEASAEPTGQYVIQREPTDEQIRASRILSHRGVYRVTIEKMCDNNDVIMSQSYGNGHGAKLFRVEPDGRIHDDQRIGW